MESRDRQRQQKTAQTGPRQYNAGATASSEAGEAAEPQAKQQNRAAERHTETPAARSRGLSRPSLTFPRSLLLSPLSSVAFCTLLCS